MSKQMLIPSELAASVFVELKGNNGEKAQAYREWYMSKIHGQIKRDNYAENHGLTPRESNAGQN